MRDPARIDRILALLRERWLEQPDQRLGQLVVNFIPRHQRGAGSFYQVDAHLVEDDALEASLARGWEQFK